MCGIRLCHELRNLSISVNNCSADSFSSKIVKHFTLFMVASVLIVMRLISVTNHSDMYEFQILMPSTQSFSMFDFSKNFVELFKNYERIVWLYIY